MAMPGTWWIVVRATLVEVFLARTTAGIVVPAMSH